MTQSIVGAIGAVDAYQLPDAKGLTALKRYITDISDEQRQKLRWAGWWVGGRAGGLLNGWAGGSVRKRDGQGDWQICRCLLGRMVGRRPPLLLASMRSSAVLCCVRSAPVLCSVHTLPCRDELLATTADDFRSFAGVLEVVAEEGTVSSVTSRAQADATQAQVPGFFDSVEQVL